MINTIIELREKLHTCAELSGKEEKTQALLIDFLRSHTTLEIHPCGDGFYAAHREDSPKKGAIALRADYDAVQTADGSAAHLCGHDGHAAALCGAALMAENKQFGRNIFFLFQPAEETGSGAEGCLELFRRESVSEIYGAHNLPGVPFGQIVTRPGTMACASRGVTLYFQGTPTHAANPENGISPSTAVGTLLCSLPSLASPSHYNGMTLCTVIGVEMGRKAFGSAASSAQVWLTLRAEHDQDLSFLQNRILNLSQSLAQEHALKFWHEVQDVFPSTENTPACAQKVLDLCENTAFFPAPLRWSEDFGHYLKVCPGALFGIGAGENHPPLHTKDYEYPDKLLQPGMNAFWVLMNM